MNNDTSAPIYGNYVGNGARTTPMNKGKIITIGFLVVILFIFGFYIYKHFYVSKYVIPNTYENEFDFIRSRLGIGERHITQDKSKNKGDTSKNKNKDKQTTNYTTISFSESQNNSSGSGTDGISMSITNGAIGGNMKTLEKTLNNDQVSASSIQETPNETEEIKYGKKGWCNIGEDRGYRSCVQVGVNDKCMSGNIFPTREVCIHPNLRV